MYATIKLYNYPPLFIAFLFMERETREGEVGMSPEQTEGNNMNKFDGFKWKHKMHIYR